jgi:hypothetical protein
MYSQVLSDVVKAAKRLHYSNKIVNSTNKIKTIWRIVKTETNNNHKNHNIPLININDKLSDNYQTIANEFNRYFANIANGTLTKNSSNNNTTNSTQFLEYLYKAFNNSFPSISLTPTNTNEIRYIIKKLKTKTSSGYDEIPMKILKVSTPYIISQLTHVINKTLSMGTFPSSLKYAQINPVFKDGEMTNIKNYRPISLLTFSKIFEKVIYKRLYNHLINNNVLAPEQYGFRNKSSTELPSYKLLNDVLT